MNRLVRIALTLFVSATILVFLVNRRLQALPKISPSDHLPAQELDRIHNEVIMVNVGFVLIAAMLLVGLVLIVTAIIRAHKSTATPHG